MHIKARSLAAAQVFSRTPVSIQFAYRGPSTEGILDAFFACAILFVFFLSQLIACLVSWSLLDLTYCDKLKQGGNLFIGLLNPSSLPIPRMTGIHTPAETLPAVSVFRSALLQDFLRRIRC